MLLSIVIPNYNYGHFLSEAIHSIFRCKATHSFEILLVDDASCDNSLEIIQQLIKKFPAIRFFHHEKNLGITEAIRTALHHSLGEYIHFFASDDLYLPNALDILLMHLNTHPHISLFSSAHAFFQQEKDMHVEHMLPTTAFHFFSQKQIFSLFRHTDFWLPGHTVVLKKSLFSKYGFFDKNLQFVMDWYLNHKMALCEGLGYIPTPLFAMRKHANSFSAAATKEKKREVWLYLIHLLEKGNAPESFIQSGIMRMLGLKSILKDFIVNPRYWKYLLPMCLKEFEKRVAHFLKIKRENYWLKKIHD